MNNKVNATLAVLGGLGAGAAAMYFLDPDRGTTRRSLVRDKVVGLSNDARTAIEGRAKDIRNRATGLAQGAKSLLAVGQSSEKSPAGFASPAENGS